MYSQDPLFTNVLRNAEQPIIRCDALRRTRALYGLCGRLIQGFEMEGGEHNVPAHAWEFLVVEFDAETQRRR